jgi:hypothetical protein
LAASHAAVIGKLEAQHKEAITEMKESAAVKAQAASTLTQILTAVTTGAMEILPVRAEQPPVRRMARRRDPTAACGGAATTAAVRPGVVRFCMRRRL